VGALSILPYPFVLLAKIMSMAADNSAPTPFWVPLSLYPIVWILLYMFSWRATAHGAVGLAFGWSSVPALAVLVVAGFMPSVGLDSRPAQRVWDPVVSM
jgi:hypothetical protein